MFVITLRGVIVMEMHVSFLPRTTEPHQPPMSELRNTSSFGDSFVESEQ